MESDFKLENVTIHYSDHDFLFVTFSFSGGDDYNGLRFEFYCQDERKHFTSTTRSDEATIVVATQGLEHSETIVETMKLEMSMTLITPKTIMINQTFSA